MTTAAANLTLEARFDDETELRRVHEAELAQGAFFLRGASSLRERERYLLVLVHPAGARLELEVEAVWLAEEGVGLQLLDFDEATKCRLRAFVDPPAPKSAPGAEANPYLRLRGLSVGEQLRRARGGELAERIALERIYGKSIWETLLSNPRLSVAEVARLARKGTLPQPLIARIAASDVWLASPEVRRALLSNPRLRGRALGRVLSALPLADLKLVEQQPAYPAPVREAARRRIKR